MGFYRYDDYDNENESKSFYATVKMLTKQKDKEFQEIPDRYKFEDYHIISFNPNR
ncbi:MAG: hypothetical protein IJ568_01550 [Bacilli bacterium]|nr:hypothetical protein [Bacilli bacterium]